MGARFASNKRAIADCDICGFQYTNLKACNECWNSDHPQLRLGEFPVDDPQAIRDPRPDRSIGESGVNSSRGIQWGWNPVGGGADPFELTPNTLLAIGSVGQVTVTT